MQSQKPSSLAAKKNELMKACGDLHFALSEASSRLMGFLILLVRVMLIPIFAVIIAADFLVCTCILTIFGIGIGLLLGLISPGDLLDFVVVHFSHAADGLMVRLQDWTTTHPNSPLAAFVSHDSTQ